LRNTGFQFLDGDAKWLHKFFPHDFADRERTKATHGLRGFLFRTRFFHFLVSSTSSLPLWDRRWSASRITSMVFVVSRRCAAAR
jgi:hypothetical protein